METEHIHAFGTRDEPSSLRTQPGFVLMLVIFFGVGLGLAACATVSPTSGPAVNLNGRAGTTFTDRITLPSPYSKIALTYHGKHNFIVTAHFEDNDGIRQQDTLVNAIGNYQGTVFVASQGPVLPVLFEIVSDDGTWEGIIESIGRTNTTFWDGQGDWVSDFFDAPTDSEWMIIHNGVSNFIVRTFCLGGSEQWVVNEIGTYSGTISIEFDGSPCVWIVNADGDWSITLQK